MPSKSTASEPDALAKAPNGQILSPAEIAALLKNLRQETNKTSSADKAKPLRGTKDV